MTTKNEQSSPPISSNLDLGNDSRLADYREDSGNDVRGLAESVQVAERDAGPEKEYQEAASAMRHYGTIQFAALTVFIAITGGLIALLYSKSTDIPIPIRFAIMFGGLLISIFFFLIELSNSYHWSHVARRAGELETEVLNYKLYSSLPGSSMFKMFRPFLSGGLFILYITVAVFWLLLLAGVIMAWF
jgi:hypothetical protein